MNRRTDAQRDRLAAHVFVCTNDRDSDYACCGDVGAEATVDAVKDWLRARNAFWSPIGVSRTDCLGLCSEGGTALTIQPRNEWYSDVQPDDVPDLLAAEFGADAEQVAESRETDHRDA
ncbi:(2Fe-2S) ferredoxin domain-containing protein [Salinadaptatus halalkaliphilus]|uniref:(2Fe-2S) ferredoxin domain-containing protein n=1 Tax=Salinadaptatus halalkaliphilus TaxID=2419781 RepID=A0A4S3TGZ7_9EURY|nr:(2Fe-2S) ferredoxin domain-containing protein [Salinadaptatus halalkaliphilus]THE62750.1 (2Fe-2S) ferredoxin domain-containing protein [Salinadaptatus halalkaliphilus]